MTGIGSIPFAKRFFDYAQNDRSGEVVIFPQRKPKVCISLAVRQISRFRKKTYHETDRFHITPVKGIPLRLPRLTARNDVRCCA